VSVFCELYYRDVTERLNERLSSLLSNVVSTSASVAASINEHLHHLQQQQQQVQRSQQTKIGYLGTTQNVTQTSLLIDNLVLLLHGLDDKSLSLASTS